MPVDTFDSIRGAVLWLAAALPILGGLIAVRALRRSPRSERPDVGRAVTAAAALAVVSGLVIGFVVAQLAGMYDSGPRYDAGLAWGAGSAVLLFLSGLAGFAFLARPGVGSRAIAGVALGPALLIGGPILGAASIAALSSNLVAANGRAEVAARSEGLQLVLSDVSTTLRPNGTVDTITLVAVVTTTRRYEVHGEPSVGGPFLTLRPVANPGGESLGVALDAGPVSFAPGTPSRFEVTLRSDPYVMLVPGSWRAEMSFVDPTGSDYLVEAPVEITGE